MNLKAMISYLKVASLSLLVRGGDASDPGRELAENEPAQKIIQN